MDKFFSFSFLNVWPRILHLYMPVISTTIYTYIYIYIYIYIDKYQLQYINQLDCKASHETHVDHGKSRFASSACGS